MVAVPEPDARRLGLGCTAASDSLSLAPASGLAPVQLISWNVAGWKTTVDHIKRFQGGLIAFLERHGADILCLQEVKLTSKVLAADAAKLGADTPGYESFWACNEGNGMQRQGLNGVATFVRQGLVVRADAQPLGDAELDHEGRCLMTDHGSFVIFNVYVPNSAGGTRLPFKMRFLKALRAAMARARQAGKAVILAGDLNLKVRPQDVHWSYRPLELSLLQGVAARGASEDRLSLSAEVRAAIEAVAASWPAVAAALRCKEHRSFETKNSRTGQVYQRWGVFVIARSGEQVRLGPPYESEDQAKGAFLLEAVGVEKDGEIVVGTGALDAELLLCRPGVLAAADVAEALRRLCGVDVAPQVLKQISDAFGRIAVPDSVSAWVRQVLDDDGMVDSFVELYPDAEERFTCWDQQKNKRHENIGSRIDYVLADRGFFARHVLRGAGLDGRGRDAASAAAALASATSDGLAQPSSFAGGGMPSLEADEYFAQFRGQPATGMVYTPQQLSDHIAVSLLLSGECRPGGVVELVRDTATQRCQPHRSARRITDFFSRRPSVEGQARPLKRVAMGSGA